MNTVPIEIRLGNRPREGCANTRCNAIAIEYLFRKFYPFSLKDLPRLSRFLGRSEASTPLLVHLRARGNSVNSYEKQLLGFDLPE